MSAVMSDAISELADGPVHGVVVAFYECLVRDKTQKQREMARYKTVDVNLTDTIVFTFGKAQCWYHTSRSGEDAGQVRKRQHISSTKILHRLVPTRSRSRIAAQCVSNRGGADHHVQPDEPPEIRYYDDEGLTEALRHDGLPDYSVLQRFVDPKEVVDSQLRNCVLQVAWQPHHCYFERRANRYTLDDTRRSIAQRAETFDGLRFSTTFPLQSPVVLEHVKDLCNAIAEHIDFTSELCIRRMLLFWKIDAASRACLLWCGGIDVVWRSRVRGQMTRQPQCTSALSVSLRAAQRLREQRKTKRRTHPPRRPAPEDPGEDDCGGAPYRPPRGCVWDEALWGSASLALKDVLFKPSALARVPYSDCTRRRERDHGCTRRRERDHGGSAAPLPSAADCSDPAFSLDQSYGSSRWTPRRSLRSA